MTRLSIPVAACLLALAWVPGTQAQEFPLSLALSGGIAGSLDQDESGFSNPTYQLRFTVETRRNNRVGIRLGRMDFGDNPLGPLFDVTIDYLTISGEYILDEPGYQSGLYMGLGVFDQAGTRLSEPEPGGPPPRLRSGDETGIGVVIGALGEFRLAERWFIYGEAAFAYTNLDVAQLFADLQVGVGFRF